ncbi:homocysteine S-methyltransferase [Rothia halotolerans]|uniref:homocysteine S-methyltransferase n=1 Tax=Rothia halotolerans TaxID=405770 RepID=UPI00192D551E|nr:homocysteine S-methyltransferase [Rothia halotolerans]
MTEPRASGIAAALRAGPLVLDAGMSTGLERLGVRTDSALWTASALREGSEAVRRVHEEHLAAGADVVITDTYQAALPTLAAAGLDRAEAGEMVRRAVAAARQARDAVRPGAFVAGSVGPYGAHLADGSEYTGAYRMDESGYRDFHRGRIALLLEAGVDLLAIETLPRADEARAVAVLLAEEFPGTPAWFSFTPAAASPAHASSAPAPPALPDGTPLQEIARELGKAPGVVAVGVNCLAPARVGEAIRALRRGTSAPIVVYPNSGESYDPLAKAWSGRDDSGEEGATSLAELAPRWVAAGASAVGGCCRTTADDVAAIARALGDGRAV